MADSDWDIDLLKQYDDRICEIAKDYGLDWFPIIYETCDYYEMIGSMAYHGMPTHYAHWSYGKSFEKTHQFYNLGMEGLPYELIINSDPSIAYLMRENPAYLQILIMAHCVGHSDFFKNNKTFENTNPQNIISKMRTAKKRIQSYIEDPSIGIDKVERILDAAHTVAYQGVWQKRKRIPHEIIKNDLVEKIKNDKNGKYKDVNINKIPLYQDYDLLGFICEHATGLEEWEIDCINIVRDEMKYFSPQMKTKIINEGWASFWHFKICNDLKLPQKYHLPFLKSHNQVVQPHIGRINPYNVGFHLFNKIEERYGLDRCFLAREICHDESFIREYFTEEDCLELNMFSFSMKRTGYSIDEISDIDGWKQVKQSLIKNISVNTIPKIYVKEMEIGNILSLAHEHDGRDLELSYADEVVKSVMILWGDVVKLHTIIEEEPWEI